jgi:CTP synthase (UTP-ammonia lyase)
MGAYPERMTGLPIAVVLDSDPTHPYHVATLAAIEHASIALSLSVETRVIPSDTLTDSGAVESYAAVVIGPGSPYRDPDAVLATIRAARERSVPLVGT